MATKVRKLRIEELSGVNRPANQEGWMVLVKNYRERGRATLENLAKRLGLPDLVRKADEGFDDADDDDALLDELEDELDGFDDDDEAIGKGDDDLSDDDLDDIEAELDALDSDGIEKGMCKGCGEMPAMKGGKGMCKGCAGSVTKQDDTLVSALSKAFGVVDAGPTIPISKNEESHVKQPTGSEIEAVVKSLTPEAREFVTELVAKAAASETAAEQAKSEVQTLAKTVQALVEKSETESRTALAKSLIPAGAPITVDEVSILLKANGDNAEGKAVVEKMLQTMGKLAAGSSLFKSFGENAAVGNASGEATAVTAINKAAGELRTANPELTPEQAVAAALDANPALYEQFMAASV
jgi:hypothetical protein